ncbi:MAG: hypothetical protein HY722_04900 [Planctomycetes bacterium]|nr:hypothetical protein [Planctomycetota bacterium]
MDRFLRLALPSLAVLAVLGAGVVGHAGVQTAGGSPWFQGSEACRDCHPAEHEVWLGTRHFASSRETHKNPLARKVLEAVGGDRNMKRNETCVLCHYTLEQEEAAARPTARSGPSCESCHGASSDWIAIHNDYGGPTATREAETPAHREARRRGAREAGMRWASMSYDLAANCLVCHGLAAPGLKAGTLAAMQVAGHPLSDFELVRYSQGSVRHRFYPPDLTTNASMDPAELSRLYVTGQAAALVAATGALGATADGAAEAVLAPWREAQQARVAHAREVLGALRGVPEAAALLGEPSEAHARALVDAIAGLDVEGQVGTLLPATADLK